MITEPLILGIDTSCDDTSVGITRGARVLANVIASQDDIHRDWGGVVPNLARRAHQENFPRVLALALKRAKITPGQLDAVAVTYGPGLAVSLEVGIEQAKQLAQKNRLPLIGVNHLEAHLLSPLAANSAGRAPLKREELLFPALGILVSGGHTEIVLIENWGKYRIIGETVDDAIGEAFDKVARLLGLGFPGGATLAKLAKQGNPDAYALPTPMRGSGDLNVSYSGLKTAARRLVLEVSGGQPGLLERQQTLDIAAAFEKTAVETLVHKIRKALEKYPVQQVLIGGGAAANALLRIEVRRTARIFGAKVYAPYSKKLCSDNGAMVALVGSFKFLEEDFVSNPDTLDRMPQLGL
jgi:N6-L-threonylcarbamoyladenine synthase